MDRYMLFPSGMGQHPNGSYVLYADAQATIAALQARVKELEQAVKETHGRFISEQAAKKDVIEELTVALKSNADGQVLIDKLMQDVLKLEAQLTQRTAELEAIETILDIDSGKTTVEKVRDLHHSFKQVWESYQDASNEMFKAQAELERVRGELDHAKKMEAVQKEVADNQTWHVQQLRAELERVKQALCDADERANEYQKALHDFESERALPLSIELERVRALVKTYADAKIDFDDKRLQEDHHAWRERYTRLVGAETILIALTATSQEGQHGQ